MKIIFFEPVNILEKKNVLPTNAFLPCNLGQLLRTLTETKDAF